MSGHGEPLATRALAALARTNAEGDALLLARIGRRLGQPRPGDLVSSVFGDEACGISDGAIRLRNIILDVARDLFIRDSNRSFGAAPFAHQFTLSQARWPGKGGCRPISELEGAALATAIGSDISLFQSGSEEQPHQAVIFRPQVVSTALEQRLEALRAHGRRNDSWVLIERPRQGCTVVVTEPA